MKEQEGLQAVSRARLIELTFDLQAVAVRLRDVDARVSEDLLRELRRLRREIRVAPPSELDALANELKGLLHAAAVEVLMKVLGTPSYQFLLWRFRGNSIDESWKSSSYAPHVRWAHAA